MAPDALLTSCKCTTKIRKKKKKKEEKALSTNKEKQQKSIIYELLNLQG
jgi:hypothetical protein